MRLKPNLFYQCMLEDTRRTLFGSFHEGREWVLVPMQPLWKSLAFTRSGSKRAWKVSSAPGRISHRRDLSKDDRSSHIFNL